MSDRKIIAFDFDGVLFEDLWPAIGNAIKKNIKIARDLEKAGHTIILWTCRSGMQLDNAVSMCEVYGLIFHKINENADESIKKYGSDSRKITADIYVDDRALLPEQLKMLF